MEICYLWLEHKRSKCTTSACSFKAPKMLLFAPNSLLLYQILFMVR
nr:MAG TPA: hypothetical protein [Caudoviricetes sp.]